MKKIIFAAMLASIVAPAFAEATLFGGQPQVVYELEHERVANQGGRANALTLYPGIRWKEGWINQAELMFTHEHEVEYEDGDVERAHNQKFAVRVKKNVQFTEHFGGFFRTLVGHKFKTVGSYNYGYVEPALTYEIGPVTLYSGYRVIRAFSNGHVNDYDLLRFGPGWEINKHHEVELRYSRAWDAVTRAKRSEAVEIEYTYRY
jgi:hypothetical protein